MIHLGPADFRTMPWANGKGVTTELWREDLDGQMIARLSRATVREDGPFSQLPGIDRTLTVLTGPGFDLVGPGVRLAARPLEPVSFSGDLPIRAENVTAPSDDFNVMCQRARRTARTEIHAQADEIVPAGAVWLCLYALGSVNVSGRSIATGEMLVSREGFRKDSGSALLIRFYVA